jgi:hypothetical protein
MKHARSDYDRIQDPADKIGEDEAVFLLRAQDAAMPLTLMDYARNAMATGASDDLVRATVEHALLARRQQLQGASSWPGGGVRAKIPDLG